MIAAQCSAQEGSLISLASCSRHLRLLCMPLVFETIVIRSRHPDVARIPPPVIRPYLQYVRLAACRRNRNSHSRSRVIYVGVPNVLPFTQELESLTELRSISFRSAPAGVPFAVIEQCLRHPRIISLSFAEDSDNWSSLAHHTVPRPFDHPYPNSLEQLSYSSIPWKVTRSQLDQVSPAHRDDGALETHSWGPLILGMHPSALSLSLPVDIAPLFAMVELPWPNLRDLTLSGRYPDASHASLVSQLVGSMRNPRSLSIKVEQPADCPRPLVLEDTPRSIHAEIRGLTTLILAYPNPDDAIFAVAGPYLKRLSLCDCPRYYVKYLYTHTFETRGLAMPILSSSECLRILSRMSMPCLEHLELVYQVDDCEDELLCYVTSVYPRLQSLELHQYRKFGGPPPMHFVSINSMGACDFH